MTNERYDIEVQDKVDASIAVKLKAIADESRGAYEAVKRLKSELAKIDVGGIGRLTKALDDNALATQRLERSRQQTIAATARAELATNRLTAAQERQANAIKKITDAQGGANDKARQAQSASNAQGDFNRQLGVKAPAVGSAYQSAQVFADHFREQDALAARATALKAATDPLYAVQQAYNRSIAEANDLMAKGAISHNDHAKVVQTLDRNYQQAVKNTQAFGNSAKFTRQQMLTVQYTVNDVAASLASGASPFTILMQQGGQVTQAFGGFKNTMSLLGQAITPLRMLIGGVTAAIGLYAMALISASKEQAAFSNAMKITSSYAGVTYGAYQEMGRAIAEATNTSVKEAKTVVMQIASTGKFQGEQIKELGQSAILLAQYTGQSADEVVKSFVRMAEGPTKYAMEMNAQFHFLSAAQIAHIRELEDTGQKTKAVSELSKSMYTWLGTNGPANLDPLAKAWHSVGNAISNAYEKFKQYVGGASAESTLSGMKAQLAELQKPLKRSLATGEVDKGAENAHTLAVNALQTQIAAQESLVRSQGQGAALAAEMAATQQQGVEAADRLANRWGKMVDNIGNAKAEIQAFRNDLAAALKANPKDDDALFAQKNQKKIEEAIYKKNAPKGTALGESRAKEMAKITGELNKQLNGFGMLAPAREVQQKMDEIDIQLAQKKLKLTDAERNTIRSKLEQIEENKNKQQALDAVYENATGPLRDYTNTQEAANRLLNEGKISAEAFGHAMNAAAVQYEEAVNPLKQISKEIADQTALLDVQGERRAVASQMLSIENQLRSRGIVLSNDERKALDDSIAALERKAAVDAEYSRIYASTKGAQQGLTDAATATNKAYGDGLLNLNAYKLSMAELGKQSLNLKLQTQTATFDDTMLASLGRLTDGYKGVADGMANSFGNMFQTVGDGFADATAHAIVFGGSFKEALGDVARQAVAGLISSLIKLGIQYTMNAAIGETLSAAATAASVGEAAVVSAAWATPAALASLATMGANAVPAGIALVETVALSSALSAAGMAGFETGGYTGNAGRKTVAGVVHGQEFVMTAEATKRNRPMLEAMNSGATPTKAPQSASPATAAASGGTRIINVLDPALLEDYLSTPSGEKVIVNVLNRNGYKRN